MARAEEIIKSSQEQAAAAWVNYLNQLRLDELMEKFAAQDVNLEQALAEIQKLKEFIGDPDHILGSPGTKHGEIAENYQVYISNARKLVDGLKPEYTFEGVGRTAPEDYLCNGAPIQSKFYVGETGRRSFEAIKEHLEKYPDFLRRGGRYEIPKDQYEKIIACLSKPSSELSRSENTLVTAIRTWERANRVKFTDAVKPSIAMYSQVQQGAVNESIAKEEESIQDADRKQRDKAYAASKPSVNQGVRVAAVSAAAEGGMAFCLGVAQKLKSGKSLAEFTAEDWRDLGANTAGGAAKGGIRGAAVYTLTNFTATPAAVATALTTAAFGVAAQARQLHQGKISEEDFLINSQVICLDVSISAIAAMMGTVMIPVPVLGAVVGNTVGMFLYGLAENHLSKREQNLIGKYRQELGALEKQLDDRLCGVIRDLQKEFAKFSSVLELAFDTDINAAFAGSIQLALYTGVEADKVLKNVAEIDAFFMN